MAVGRGGLSDAHWNLAEFLENFLANFGFNPFIGTGIEPSELDIPNLSPAEVDDIWESIDPGVKDFMTLFLKGIEGLDADDIDRINRQEQANEWLDAYNKYLNDEITLEDLQAVDVSDLSGMDGWDAYYSGIVGDTTDGDGGGDGDDGLGELDSTTSNADIRQILKDNGYSDEAIEEIFKAEVNNDRFKGNNVLSNALCQIGYSNCSYWSVTAKYPDGTACSEGFNKGTYKNGECVIDTSEGTSCTAETEDGAVEGKRGPNGECIPLGSSGGASDTNCVVITQENADECGFLIDENGNLVDKDRDPDAVDGDSVAPFYTNCGGGIFAETEEDCPDLEGTGTGIGNCSIINSENADECGYEITSDGQLIPKDLSGDPTDYPNYDNCGNGVFVLEGTECPDVPITYSDEEKSTAEAIRDWIEGQIGKIEDMTVDDILDVIFGGDAWDPLCKEGELEDAGGGTRCEGTDGTPGNKCWKDCVSINVLGGIPGIPLPPGVVDIGTIRDLENTVNEVGGSYC